MCMRANVVDAFLLGREGVVRYQWRRVKHCLSCASANQPEPEVRAGGQGVTKRTMCTRRRRMSVQSARGTPWHSGLRDRVAEEACKSALHEWVESANEGPTVCSNE